MDKNDFKLKDYDFGQHYSLAPYNLYADEESEGNLPHTRCSEELNSIISDLMDDYASLVNKAKSFGLDIRLHNDSKTLELYFNDDYPDTLLVDKEISSEKRGDSND